MPTILITGANRGLGLEFVRQYIAANWRVIATCRNPELAQDLKEIRGEKEIFPMDVSDFKSVEKISALLRLPLQSLLLLIKANLMHIQLLLKRTHHRHEKTQKTLLALPALTALANTSKALLAHSA